MTGSPVALLGLVLGLNECPLGLGALPSRLVAASPVQHRGGHDIVEDLVLRRPRLVNWRWHGSQYPLATGRQPFEDVGDACAVLDPGAVGEILRRVRDLHP